MKKLTKNELEKLVSELFEALTDEVKFCKDNQFEVSAQSEYLIDRCKVLEVKGNE